MKVLFDPFVHTEVALGVGGWGGSLAMMTGLDLHS